MGEINLFQPTKVREFTYYDRCAIAFDSDEMAGVRVRVFLEILGSPLERYVNLRYPVYQSFYGYFQTFWQGWIVDTKQIEYPKTLVFDYWNEHATMANQLVSVFQKLRKVLYAYLIWDVGVISTSDIVLPLLTLAYQGLLEETYPLLLTLEKGLTEEVVSGSSDEDATNDYVNTFQTPINLVRFRFPVGTVFRVRIESWRLGLTEDGTRDGNQLSEVPYPTTNPNPVPPEKTSGTSDPLNPYGAAPPPQSPLDPALDPADFSDAPPPDNAGLCLSVIGDVQVAGLDESPRAIDFVFGPFPAGFTAAFELAGNTSDTPPKPFYNLRIRDASGVVLSEPFTGDILAEASLIYIDCPA